MQKYTYSFLAKLIYRYANIPISIILAFYGILSLMIMTNTWYFIIPAFINIALLYVINKFYIKGYKLFPYTILIDNKKIVCRDFMFSNKEITIKLSDIDEIKGGIFSGNNARPVYIHDGANDVTIGIRQHLKGYNKFVTTVLSNVKRPLYQKLLNTIKEMGDKVTEKRNKRR